MGDQCLLHDGLERCYQLFEPDGAAPDARVPLVIDLHGWTSNPNEQRFISGFEHLASEEGFFVAWPEGVRESFNAGRVCCPPALRDDVDDVGFLRALIDRLASDHPIDRDRVYLTGLSNGCAMAQRMTAEASDLIAATACFSFYLLSDAPGDYQPVPVMEIHATADALVSYDEGRAGLDRTVPTAQENIARWAQLNGCQIEPTVTAEQGWSRTEYTSCDDDADVSLVTIDGSGHVPYRGMNTEIDTTSIAWAFLESRRLSDR